MSHVATQKRQSTISAVSANIAEKSPSASRRGKMHRRRATRNGSADSSANFGPSAPRQPAAAPSTCAATG